MSVPPTALTTLDVIIPVIIAPVETDLPMIEEIEPIADPRSGTIIAGIKVARAITAKAANHSTAGSGLVASSV
jgi:hypothetical protein